MAKAKKQISSDLYTAILAIATAVVLATVAFVAFRSYNDYDTLFQTKSPAGVRGSARR